MYQYQPLLQIKVWLNQWNDVEKSRKVYRLLHDAFIANEERLGFLLTSDGFDEFSRVNHH
jgi:hypothetical protein